MPKQECSHVTGEFPLASLISSMKPALSCIWKTSVEFFGHNASCVYFSQRVRGRCCKYLCTCKHRNTSYMGTVMQCSYAIQHFLVSGKHMCEWGKLWSSLTFKVERCYITAAHLTFNLHRGVEANFKRDDEIHVFISPCLDSCDTSCVSATNAATRLLTSQYWTIYIAAHNT